MKLNEEIRKQILEEFIKIFPRFADQAYQQRVWIRGEGPECDDYDEAVNQYYDSAESILEQYKDFGVTENQYLLLLKFHEKIEVHSFKKDIEGKYLSRPEWNQIIGIAKEILAAFNYKKSPVESGQSNKEIN